MHPAAEDNYGYDACAILCLPCVPNILVIATESGMLYHCVVLEGEEEDDQVVSLAPSREAPRDPGDTEGPCSHGVGSGEPLTCQEEGRPRPSSRNTKNG